MAEEDADDKWAERSRQLREEWDEFTRTHKHATEEQLAAFKHEVNETLRSMGDADRAEREKLANDLQEIKDAQAAERKAREEKEKKESGSGTIVVPPSQIPSTGASEGGNANQPVNPATTEPAPRRGRFLRYW